MIVLRTIPYALNDRFSSPRLNDDATNACHVMQNNTQSITNTLLLFSMLFYAKQCALDRSDTFSAPVVETYPALATTYYKVIRDPMDFRTIREDRMDHYESIQELQQDLILVFSNCCKFNNGPATDIYEHAIKLWSEINHIFQVTCNKFRIRLPEGWDAS
mmetsp:Transcript_9680/g.26367  ORF Transcript_9680/g.26367 Transcript_9680/m.26367 type:complete len:160 (+) Transcript_9680:301-780(+)